MRVHVERRSFGDNALHLGRKITRLNGLVGREFLDRSFHVSYTLPLTHLRILLFQLRQLWKIVVHDVWIVGIVIEKVLVITLGGVKAVKGYNLGHDGSEKDLGVVELLNVRFSNLFLIVIHVENRGTILSTSVRTLPV